MTLFLSSPRRPQSIAEVLDAAFLIFKVTLVRCLPYGLIAMVVSQSQSIYNIVSGRPLQSHDLFWWLFLLLGTVLSVALSSAIILRQVAVLERRSTTFTGDLTEALGRLPAMITALAVGLIAVTAGLIFLIVPGIYLALAFLMAGPVIVLARKPPLEALRSGLRLMRRHGLRAFTVLAIGLSVVLVFDVLMFTFVAVLLQFAGSTDVAVVTAFLPVVVICLGSITAPFGCALTLALYSDLSARAGVAAPNDTPPAVAEHLDGQVS